MRSFSNSAATHFAVCSSESVLVDRVVSRGLLPPRSPDLKPYDCCLWDVMRDEAYSDNPRTEEGVKGGIQDVVSSLPLAELRRTVNHFLKCDARVRAEGTHLQHTFFQSDE